MDRIRKHVWIRRRARLLGTAAVRTLFSSGQGVGPLSAAKRCRPAFTLVELLVVIAIIGMILGLTLPAVNAARERGRATTCKNHLRQLALASLVHEQTNGFLPTGGWSGAWVGVPGRGAGVKQAGAWGYTLLPYLERNDLAELGRDLPAAQREAVIGRLLQTPLTVMNCPTRRPAAAYQIFYGAASRPRGSVQVFQVARTDYAMNAGDQPRCEISDWIGPPDLEFADDPYMTWPDVSDHTGVSYLRSQVTLAAIRDGSSRTYLLGEKQLEMSSYFSGEDHGDDWSMYTGYQDDIHRTTHTPPRRDSEGSHSCSFGSPHPKIWHAAFCDASVRALSFGIDPEVHRSLGNRADALVFGDEKIE